jgi:cyclic pyranopterin phosphate synthase
VARGLLFRPTRCRNSRAERTANCGSQLLRGTIDGIALRGGINVLPGCGMSVAGSNRLRFRTIGNRACETASGWTPVTTATTPLQRANHAMSDLSHFDADGASRMVDVGAKDVTARYARAHGLVRMLPATLTLIRDRKLSKGDVLEVARLAGIMAAKKTAELIPLCHPLPLDSVKLSFDFPDEATVTIAAEVRVTARTGVEMEALTAASVAALTIYDMCKAVDRGMTIESIRLEEKLGGKSGHFERKSEARNPKSETNSNTK